MARRRRMRIKGKVDCIETEVDVRVCLKAQSQEQGYQNSSPDPELSVLGQVTETLNFRIFVKTSDVSSTHLASPQVTRGVWWSLFGLSWKGKEIPYHSVLCRGWGEGRVQSFHPPSLRWADSRQIWSPEPLRISKRFFRKTPSAGRTPQLCVNTNHVAIPGRHSESSFNGWFSRRATCKQTAGVGAHVPQNYNLTFRPVFSLYALWGSEPCLPHLSSRVCVVCTLWCQQPALRWIGTFGFPPLFRIASFPSKRDGMRADTNLTSPFLKGLAASLQPEWLVRRHSRRVIWSRNEPWFNRWAFENSPRAQVMKECWHLLSEWLSYSETVGYGVRVSNTQNLVCWGCIFILILKRDPPLKNGLYQINLCTRLQGHCLDCRVTAHCGQSCP